MNAIHLMLSGAAPAVLLQGLGDLVRRRYLLAIIGFLTGLAMLFLWRWGMTQLLTGTRIPGAVLAVVMAPLVYIVLWTVNNVRYAQEFNRERESELGPRTLQQRILAYVLAFLPLVGFSIVLGLYGAIN